MNGMRCIQALTLALLATSASAVFHTFQIEELYSNADGSIQFIVLSMGFNDEN